MPKLWPNFRPNLVKIESASSNVMSRRWPIGKSILFYFKQSFMKLKLSHFRLLLSFVNIKKSST